MAQINATGYSPPLSDSVRRPPQPPAIFSKRHLSRFLFPPPF